MDSNSEKKLNSGAETTKFNSPTKEYCATLFLVCLFIILFISSRKTSAQTVSLNLRIYEEAIRRGQLLGEVDSLLSFNVRPLHREGNENWFLNGVDFPYFSKKLIHLNQNKVTLDLLPVNVYSEYNSHHPYGWNNGSLLRARGLQTQLSGGFLSKIGGLHIQVRPEFNFIQNRLFQGFYRAHPSPNNANTITEYYYTYHYNRIDLPEKFGNKSVFQVLPGQSWIKYFFREFAFGLSTENLWWGPAKRNSLLMSNNARGFAHLTLHTTKPIKTTIGAFEGQALAGRLNTSGYLPPQHGLTTQRASIYNPKNPNWRYLTGLTLSYSPKWVPGLFIGMSSTQQQYADELDKFTDYIPAFNNFKRSIPGVHDNLYKKDRYSSVYLRWVWKEANAESYFEYGRSNALRSFRRFVITPERSRAFTFGLVKLRPLARKDQFIQVHAEVTQLQQSVAKDIRNGINWYTNTHVRHGYTHRGEVLGAGIGPGSNVQFLEVSWIKGMKKLGLQLERLVNNNDFYYYAYTQSKDFRRHWIDLSGGVNVNYQFGQFLFSGKFQYIRTLNYWWELNQQPEDPYFINGKDVTNLHATFGATYLFR